MANKFCIVGLRKSAPINKTFFPCCPKTTAKFEIVVVFPSPGSAEVTIIERTWLSTDVNSMFVRMLRYCSVIRDLGFYV